MSGIEQGPLGAEILEPDSFSHKASESQAFETDNTQLEAVMSVSPKRLLVPLLDAFDGLFVVIDRAGRIAHLNRTGANLCGYTRAELWGKSMADVLVAPEDRAEMLQVLDELWAAPLAAPSDATSRVRFELSLITKVGERRRFRFCARRLGPIPDDESVDRADDQPHAVSNLRAGGVVVTGFDLTRERTLQREMIDADERVRQRFGQELHDMLASHLAGTAVMASALARKAEKHAADSAAVSAEDLRHLTELVRDAMEQVRALSHSFVAPELEAEGLAVALTRLAERTEAATGVACKCRMGAGARSVAPPGDVATHLYRIAQEAVSNAVTHGDPTCVEISLAAEDRSDREEWGGSLRGEAAAQEAVPAFGGSSADEYDAAGFVGEPVLEAAPSVPANPADGGRLVLTIRDDGPGLPEDITAGVGLGNMRRRAQLIGASLRVGGAAAGGTLVQCSMRTPVGETHR